MREFAAVILTMPFFYCFSAPPKKHTPGTPKGWGIYVVDDLLHTVHTGTHARAPELAKHTQSDVVEGR
uniref:Putative secreted protein n=1 Tax=Anopheles triannulatus TaxID=58253 RepID=A0A2M4B4V9_9DIPT